MNPDKPHELTETGRVLAKARTHLIQYMKDNPTPIRTPDLIDALLADAKKQGYKGGSDITLREAYTCMVVSERQKRTIETSRDWYMVWHEYVKDDVMYRGHVYDKL